MIILIDGASSWLAKRLAHYFLDRGHQCILAGRSSTFDLKKESYLQYYRGNIDYMNLANLCKHSPNIDLYIQLASATPSSNLADSLIYESNKSWCNDLNLILHSLKPKNVATISSMSVYNTDLIQNIDSSLIPIPKSGYGLSKLLLEQASGLYANMVNEVKQLVLRLPGLLNPTGSHIFLAKALDLLKAGQMISLPSQDALFNNATCSSDIGQTILKWLDVRETCPTEVCLNMHSADTQPTFELMQSVARTRGFVCPKFTYTHSDQWFTIGNAAHSDLLSLSSLENIIEDYFIEQSQ